MKINNSKKDFRNVFYQNFFYIQSKKRMICQKHVIKYDAFRR